jgi:hypothetical protein
MELIWIKTKTFALKVWEFIKLYGKEIIFIVLIIYAFVLVKSKTKLIEQLLEERKQVRKAHQENIARLTQQIEIEQAARRKIESDYQTLIERINKEHNDEIKRIAAVKEEEIKALIKKHQNNPVLMAQSINSIFGIPVMPVPEQRQDWEPNE